MAKKKKKVRLVDMLLTFFFSDPVLTLNVNEVFRTKIPPKPSTKNRFSAKVRENPKFSLPQAKKVRVSPFWCCGAVGEEVDLFGGAPHKGF